MFSEVSQAKWRKPNAIPGFPIEMVSTLVPRSLVDEDDKRCVRDNRASHWVRLAFARLKNACSNSWKKRISDLCLLFRLLQRFRSRNFLIQRLVWDMNRSIPWHPIFLVKTRVIYCPIKLEINLEPFFHQILRINRNFSTWCSNYVQRRHVVPKRVPDPFQTISHYMDTRLFARINSARKCQEQ